MERLNNYPIIAGASEEEVKMAKIEALYNDVVLGNCEYFLKEFFDVDSNKLLDEKMQFLIKMQLHRQNPDIYERPSFEEEKSICEKFADKLKRETESGIKEETIY